MGIVKCNCNQPLYLMLPKSHRQSLLGSLLFYVRTLKETLDSYGIVLGSMEHVTWVSEQLVSVEGYFR